MPLLRQRRRRQAVPAEVARRVDDQVVPDRHVPAVEERLEAGLDFRFKQEEDVPTGIEEVADRLDLGLERLHLRAGDDHDGGVGRHGRGGEQRELVDDVVLALQGLRDHVHPALLCRVGVALLVTLQEVDLLLLRAREFEQRAGEVLLGEARRLLLAFAGGEERHGHRLDVVLPGGAGVDLRVDELDGHPLRGAGVLLQERLGAARERVAVQAAWEERDDLDVTVE